MTQKGSRPTVKVVTPYTVGTKYRKKDRATTYCDLKSSFLFAKKGGVHPSKQSLLFIVLFPEALKNTVFFWPEDLLFDPQRQRGKLLSLAGMPFVQNLLNPPRLCLCAMFAASPAMFATSKSLAQSQAPNSIPRRGPVPSPSDQNDQKG